MCGCDVNENSMPPGSWTFCLSWWSCLTSCSTRSCAVSWILSRKIAIFILCKSFSPVYSTCVYPFSWVLWIYLPRYWPMVIVLVPLLKFVAVSSSLSLLNACQVDQWSTEFVATSISVSARSVCLTFVLSLLITCSAESVAPSTSLSARLCLCQLLGNPLYCW